MPSVRIRRLSCELGEQVVHRRRPSRRRPQVRFPVHRVLACEQSVQRWWGTVGCTGKALSAHARVAGVRGKCRSRKHVLTAVLMVPSSWWPSSAFSIRKGVQEELSSASSTLQLRLQLLGSPLQSSSQHSVVTASALAPNSAT